jgi:hypothetical protein
MRRFHKFLVIATFATLLVTGCSKDDDNDTPDPVVPPTNKELLTAKTWQLGETYQNLTGTRIHYLKGGENTSGVDMGALRLKFNADGTGSHTDVDGNNYTLTWAFTSADERSIHITIGGNIIIDWYFVDIQADVLLQSANVPTNGLVNAKWIPVP